jgi:hypothetical protein
MKLLHHHGSRVVAVGSLVGTLLLGSAGADAQTCPSYPIALPAQLLLSVPTNTVINDIFNGAQLNNFGWLTWTGDSSDSTLLTSLTAPGDSTDYVNPDNPADQEINAGDWVSGRASVSNRSSMRNALNNLLGMDIIVPVFDDVRGSGSSLAYHVAGFAHVQLVDYRLPSMNKISILFIEFTDCSGGGDGGPGV